jgi:DtxR family Mn-dependent transcriptional regulator
MPAVTLSDAIQDYLREIYRLAEGGRRVTTTALARGMGVSPASASAMVKKLAALNLVEHAPYRGVSMTPDGEKVAIEVHDEADRLEHVLSEELEARIDEALGYPTHDPHGDPIPDANLNWPDRP